VGDVAKALARVVSEPAAGGKTYELAGPAVFTFRELMVLLLKETGRRRLLLPLPWGVASLIGSLGHLSLTILGDGLFVPPVTADQVTLLRADNVASGALPGLAELGVTPTTLEAVLPSYLYRYRPGGQYADQEARELAAI
jgi:NADH dehydrogenase